MKLKILLIAMMVLGLRLPAQAQSYPSPKDSIVWTQIASENFIEAIEAYESSEQPLHPFIELLYQACINRALGRYEKCIPYFQEIIEHGLGNLDSVGIVSSIELMSDFCERTNNIEKLIWLEHKLGEYADNPTTTIDLSRNKISQLQDKVRLLARKVEDTKYHSLQRKTVDTLQLIYESSILQVPITLNGIETSAIVDTGVTERLAIHHTTAQAFGIKATLKKTRLNNIDLNGAYTKVDSLQLGATTFYNVPIFIYDTSPLDTLSLQEGIDSIKLAQAKEYQTLLKKPFLGLKLLNRYGSIKIDIPNRQMILQSMELTPTLNERRPNFFETSNRLFLVSWINGKKGTLFIDTGDNGAITLSHGFYKRHQEHFPTLPDSLSLTRVAMQVHHIVPVRYRVLDKPMLKISNRALQLTDRLKGIYIDDKIKYLRDGAIGIEGLHLLGNKICFDFKNMHLSFED